MSRINLLNRIKRTIVAADEEVATVWYVAKRVNGVEWYLFDVDKSVVTWTTKRKKAMQFLTQQGIDTFIHSTPLRKRTDVHTICSHENPKVPIS